jgi:hypothetical protein
MVDSLNVVDTTQFIVELLLHFSLVVTFFFGIPQKLVVKRVFTIVVMDLALSSLLVTRPPLLTHAHVGFLNL